MISQINSMKNEMQDKGEKLKSKVRIESTFDDGDSKLKQWGRRKEPGF